MHMIWWKLRLAACSIAPFKNYTRNFFHHLKFIKLVSIRKLSKIRKGKNTSRHTARTMKNYLYSTGIWCFKNNIRFSCNYPSFNTFWFFLPFYDRLINCENITIAMILKCYPLSCCHNLHQIKPAIFSGRKPDKEIC